MVEPFSDEIDTPTGRPERDDSTDDFADEHSATAVDDKDVEDHGETESPNGNSGLEPTDRPN